MKKLGFAILTILVLSMGGARAADCSKVLIQDNTSYNSTLEKHLSYLNVVNSNSYKSQKKSIKHGGEAVIEGIPFKSDFNWDKFTEYRNSVFRKYQYEEDTKSALSYLHQTLPDQVVNAYIRCLEINARENGFYAYASYVDSEVVVVSMRWSDSSTNPRVADVKVVYSRGTTTDRSIVPPTIPPNKTESFPFERIPNEEFVLLIGGAGQTPFKVVMSRPPNVVVPKPLCSVEVEMYSNYPMTTVTHTMGPHEAKEFVNFDGHVATCKTDDRCYVKAIRKSGDLIETGHKKDKVGATTNPGGVPSYSTLCKVLRRQ